MRALEVLTDCGVSVVGYDSVFKGAAAGAGFTAMSDHMEPAEVQRFPGEYFEEMTACVFRNGGAVDKFMGDVLMAFFGCPEAPGVDTLENARLSALAGVRAGVETQAAVSRLNRRWQAQGRGQIAIRIGLNTGHAIVGDMGSASRREFTLLGRNVNLSQRLEEAAPPGGVLLSARTAALVQGQFRLASAGALKLKGFDKEEQAMTVDLPQGSVLASVPAGRPGRRAQRMGPNGACQGRGCACTRRRCGP